MTAPRRLWPAPFLLLAVLSTVACTSSATPRSVRAVDSPASASPNVRQEAGRYSLRGDEVAVYNLAGDLTVRGGEGEAVTVDVSRGGPDAGRLEVRTGSVRGHDASLRVVYPGDRIRYGDRGSQTHLRVRDDGTFGGGHGRRVRISGRGGGLEAHADLTVAVPEGQRLSLHVGVGRVEVSNVEGDLTVDTHSGGIETRATRGALNLDTGSGSVRVTDAGGDLSVDTGSGSVRLEGVEGDAIHVDTGSGRVRGGDLSATRVEVDTGSGSIELSRVAARQLFTDTGSGSIRVDLTSDVESLEADTGSGDVVLTVPESFGARIDVEAGSGSVDVDFPIRLRRAGDGEMAGEIGDGSGRVVVDTGSGSVRISRR